MAQNHVQLGQSAHSTDQANQSTMLTTLQRPPRLHLAQALFCHSCQGQPTDHAHTSLFHGRRTAVLAAVQLDVPPDTPASAVGWSRQPESHGVLSWH